MTKIPERFKWAADLMAIEPNNKVLEIGCGAGLLAEQIALKLNTGTLVALDKSAAMIKMAANRNKQFIQNNLVQFINTDFNAFEPATTFDKIAAFNINFFQKHPTNELKLIRRILTNEGQLYIFYQAPYQIDISAAEPIKQNLQKFSFTTVAIIFKNLTPTPALCIIAKPNL